jgi:glycosyltransferase involved in cell wall biosynthesis
VSAASVSVVITCYNLERFIAEAIESVLAQRDVGEVDIVVVDDCSTDKSADIIGGFAAVRYVRTPANTGVLLATLAGIEAAAHDTVAFLDGDDLWETDKLSAIVAAFEADERAALVTHDLRYADADGTPINRTTRPEQVLTAADPAHRPGLVRQGILHHRDYVWLGSALAIRRSLAQAGAFTAFARALPDPQNTYQDWPLAFWIASFPDINLAYVPEKLFRYRLHGLNYSGDATTLEKALRNLTRTYNTADAIHRIAVMHDLPTSVRRSTERQLLFSQFLLDLYAGRRAAAARGWFRSAGDLLRRGIILKETVRFIAIQTLGPSRFSELLKRRRSRQ